MGEYSKYGFAMNDMARLNELINAGDEENAEQHASNGPMGPIPVKRNTDGVAKPFAKVTATVNNRRIGDTSTKQENVVWDPEEVKEFVVDKNEKRPSPQFEVVYKQRVGTEDVYLGMSGLDPSTTKCQCILVKIKLPGTKLAEIQCDLNKQSLLLQTPKYFLHHYFNHEIKDKDSKAKWVSDKEELHVEVPVVNHYPF